MTMIFVFGSNLAGRHGAGAAKAARMHHGAMYGVGEGRTGNAYAIPTLDGGLRKLQLHQIQAAVNDFRAYAEKHPELEFFVTRIGCGLAGFTDAEIAPMFHSMPRNCVVPREWADSILGIAEQEGIKCAFLRTHEWETTHAVPLSPQ